MSVFEKQVYVPAELLQALGDHTGNFWSSPALDPIICDAIRAWMKPAPAIQPQPVAASEAGYQWKQVFLPAGTRLRACFGGQPQFAVVVGAQVKYGKRSLSPSGFANLRGSGNRNAWKAIWLRLPGSDEWLLADVCRSARKSAIARLFAGDPPAAKPRPRTAPSLRQAQQEKEKEKGKGKGKGKAKPQASRRTRASGVQDGARAAVAVRSAAPAAASLPTKVHPSSPPGAAQGNAPDAALNADLQRKKDSGAAARRKRRARKHASATS